MWPARRGGACEKNKGLQGALLLQSRRRLPFPSLDVGETEASLHRVHTITGNLNPALSYPKSLTCPHTSPLLQRQQ